MSKENKPRWKSLNMYERLARHGVNDEIVEWLHQKSRGKEASKEDCD